MGKYPLGSKAFVGGVVLILLGIYFLFNGDVEHATTLIALALGILGIRDKLERNLKK